MGGLIPFLIFGAILAWPFTRLLPRAGLSPWLALVCFVPFGFIVLLYIIALKDWS